MRRPMLQKVRSQRFWHPGESLVSLADPDPFPPPVRQWADDLAATVANEPLFQHTSVFAFDAARDGLVLAAMRWGSFLDTGDVRAGEWTVPLEGSICGRVFRTGRPALVADVRVDPDYRDFPGARTRSELAVPIVAAGRVVGVVNLESARVDSFTIDDLDRVRAIADVAGAAFAALALGDLLGLPPAA
jgi:GAF domain-containing protein